MAEIILVRVRRCRYCGREMFCSPLEYEQNPFCTVCLSERIDKATPAGGVRWRSEGNYVIAEAARKRHRGVHGRSRD
jgi:hypothetical protein